MANENLFDDKAEFYNARPNYPKECIDYLIGRLGLDSQSVIADIGAGTGKLTLPFLHTVAFAYAVEPNDDMFGELQKNLSVFSNIKFMHSMAENTGIPQSTCDAVVVGTAFHWFDKKEFFAECKRILRDNKMVAILRISNNTDADKQLDRMWHHTEEDLQSAKAFLGDGFLEHVQFEYSEPFDEDRYIRFLLSSATAPTPGEERFKEYIEKCKTVYRKHFGDEIAHLPFVVNCFIGKM